MSGSTIGGVVGAVIGFYVGGPAGAQWGWMIGSAVGGYVDPEHVKGVQLGDLSPQSSVSGMPISIVFGTSVVKGCRVISQSEIRIRVEEEQAGKGGGPVVENEVAYQDFTIEVCESSALRGTVVQGILVVWQDGQIVYDARPDPLISNADSAKWKRDVTFYYGAEDQEPDPTEESYLGFGQVPAYRGKCRMVFKNRNISKFGNRIPQYECLVSSCSVQEGVVDWLAHIVSNTNGGRFLDSPNGEDWSGTPYLPDGISGVPTTGRNRLYRFGTSTFGVGFADTNGGPGAIVRLQDTGPWQGLGGGVAGADVVAARRGSTWFWTDGGTGNVNVWNGTDTSELTGLECHSLATTPDHLYTATFSHELACRTDDGTLVRSINAHPYSFPDPRWFSGTMTLGSHDGTVVWLGTDGEGRLDISSTSNDCISIQTHNDHPMPIVAGATMSNIRWSEAYRWVITFGNRLMHGVSLTNMSLIDHEFPDQISGFADDGNKIVVCCDDGTFHRSFNLTEWEALDSPSSALYTRATSLVPLIPEGGTELPDSPGYYYDPATGTIVGPEIIGEVCGTNLAAIVTKACELCQIPAEEIDVSELEGTPVRGYTMASAISGRGAIDPLTRTFFFDCPEFDSKIRFHKRGQALIDVVVDPDSMIDIDDPEDEDTIRGQQVEFPRRHHLKYIAYDQDYVFTDAPAERKSPDVRVVGETSVEAPLVLDTDEAARTADIQLKVLWTEREDTRKFALPLEYLGIVGGTLLDVSGRRFRADEYRFEDGAIYVERAAYDRASAYTSNATGANGHRATPPPSSLIGPTYGVMMNLPALRVDDDKPGLYVAGTSALTGWYGYSVETSLDPANGYEVRIGAVQSRATIGLLTAPLQPAERDFTDAVNTLAVSLIHGELNSITDSQFFSGGNAAAILYPDGTAEIVQFRDAVETSDGEYELTMLNRGRLDTTIANHSAGATFVVLNNALRFVELTPSDLGQTITYRLASLGTARADNPTDTIFVGEFESQREWSVTNLAAGRDGSDNVTVTWDGRPTLGTNVQPQHHAAFAGYQLEYDDGSTMVTKMVARTPLVIVSGVVQTDEVTTHTYTAAEQAADFGGVPSSLDVRVSAINTYAGAGPSTEITV